MNRGRRPRKRYNRSLKLGCLPSFAQNESPVENRFHIPGYYYDAVKDSYFRVEPGFFAPPPLSPPSLHPKTRHRANPGDIRNVLGVLQQHRLGRLSPDTRLRFVLRTVQQRPALSEAWPLEHPEQVLVRPDASSLVIIDRQPSVGQVRFVGHTLEWKNRTSPRLTCPTEFHRCADGLTAQLAGCQTAEGDAILAVRNPKFGESCPARIHFLRVAFSNLSTSDAFTVTMSQVAGRGINRYFRSSHVVCATWSPRYRAVLVGGDRETMMYSVDQQSTEMVGRKKACSLAVSGDTIFVGEKAEVLLYDVRAGIRLPASNMEISGGAVIKQLATIKDGRYLLAEDQVGTVYQCDPRYPERAIASMKNRTPNSIRYIPFQLDEQEDILTCSIPGHGAHLWDLRTNSFLRCLPVSGELLTAAFRREWDSILLFCREGIDVAPLC